MKQKRAVLAAAGIVAAVGVAFFWMRGDSSADGERSIDPPEEYRIGGVDVIALPVMSDGSCRLSGGACKYRHQKLTQTPAQRMAQRRR